MSEMGKHRAGLFGVGYVAGEYIKALNNNNLSEVVAVVGRDRKTTQRRIAEMEMKCDVLDQYSDLLDREDISVVVITSPHFLHASEAIAAAQAGKHLIVEKPIGMTYKEVQEVSEAVKTAGVKFQTGFVLRWYPYSLNVRQMIDDGLLGEIFYLEVDYFHELGPWWNGFTWGVNEIRGGPSAPLVGGIHAVDGLRWFAGDEAVKVFAHQTWGHRRDFEYAPSYIANVKFKNGAIGKTSCSYEIESPYMMNFILHGTKGSIVNDRFYLKKSFPGQTGWQRFETIMPDSGAVSHHPFQSLVDDFIEALENDGETELNIETTLKTHELCFAIEKSMETGAVVTLPLE
jgi:predicted dehydrogenase